MKKHFKENGIIYIITLLLVACIWIIAVNSDWYKTEKLIKAIKSEDIIEIERLLKTGIDPHKTDVQPSWVWTLLESSPNRPLTIACKTGNLEIVKMLIDYGATAEPIDGTGYSPLNAALFYYQPDDIELVNVLLDNGADINEVEDVELVFIAAKMTPKVYDKHKTNGTVFASGYDENTAKGITEIVCILLNNRSVNITTESGETLLMFSAKSGNEYLVKYLLDNGADVSLVDYKGRTALDYAIQSNNAEVIELFKNR